VTFSDLIFQDSDGRQGGREWFKAKRGGCGEEVEAKSGC